MIDIGAYILKIAKTQESHIAKPVLFGMDLNKQRQALSQIIEAYLYGYVGCLILLAFLHNLVSFNSTFAAFMAITVPLLIILIYYIDVWAVTQ